MNNFKVVADLITADSSGRPSYLAEREREKEREREREISLPFASSV